MSVHAARRSDAPSGGRLLSGLRRDRPIPFREHTARLGPLQDGAALVEEVACSGLRGRGGASFDTATKLRSVASARARPVVVANGAEGEPASGKDKVLLRLAPQLVLDGIVAAAQAVGAREGVVAVAASARTELAAVVRALAERPAERVRLRAATVPDGFVSGEESALLNALGGGPAKPTLKPPFPFERGLGGAPTLVQNVETLAHLALIARFGGDWFRSVGTADAPGTALVTLSGAVRRPGIYEIELGTSLADLIGRAGGETEPLAAILVGGYFGRWVTAAESAGLRLVPGVLGAGAIVAMPAAACALAELSGVVRYLARESAGQCGPCVHGLSAIAGAFDGLGADPAARGRIERWSAQVRGRGACKHPDGVAGLVHSALVVFEPELRRHAKSGGCGSATRRAVLPVPARRA